ncbi:MAG: hypothetical protein IJT45_04375 [Bacteroidales bacterium]|nr:hypothetical protein [Bacteroidales bacterium]
MEYKRLGDYIRLVDVRNRDLTVTNLLGLSIEKKFITSIANTIGTDMSVYKIVRPMQFAYVPVTSRNGEKITVALYDGKDAAIISQAYTIFEIVDQDVLLSEYLMMWFRRPEFDRYARFHSHGSAREVFDWDELCNVMLPVPDIDRQRDIVSEYETLSNRIRLNEQMIANLEETAQTIYIKECAGEISENPLAFDRRKYILKEFVPVITGKKDANIATEDGIYKFFTCSKDDFKTDCYSFDEEALILAGNGDFNVKYYKGKFEAYQRTYVLVPNDLRIIGLLYNAIQYNMSEMAKGARGSVISFLTKDMVENVSFYAPHSISDFENVLALFNNSIKLIYYIKSENEKLTELQSLLLARMGK